MNLTTIHESDIEAATIEWLTYLDYTVLHGPDIAPDTSNAERSTYKEVILTRRLQDAVAHLNPTIPLCPVRSIEQCRQTFGGSLSASSNCSTH